MDAEVLVIEGCPHETGAVSLLREALGAEGLPVGVDLFAEPGRAPALACRVYRRGDTPGGLPSLEDLRRALRQAAGER